MKIKVYQMNDYDWVAAATPEEATRCYHETCDADPEDEPPIEMCDDIMNTFIFHRDESARNEDQDWTFAKELAYRIEAGHKFPCFFASTEW